MLRLARLDAPGVLHHVMGRGIEKNNIYVVNFIKRHKSHGHLFQNRYKSIVCQEDAYLLELVRYIHLNLCDRVCKKRKVSLAELLSENRRHELIKARRAVSWIAVHELGYSGAEVARHLGVTNSCVTRFLSTGKEPDIEGALARYKLEQLERKHRRGYKQNPVATDEFSIWIKRVPFLKRHMIIT